MNARQRGDVRITLTVPGYQPLDITLSYPLDPGHEAVLRAISEGGNEKELIECRMHDNDPALRDLRAPDGRIHGAWLYVRRNPYAAARNAFPLLLCHWPKGVVTGSHAVPSRMTPEHRRRQEYIARRGDAAGHEVQLEKSLAHGTRSDVVVKGQEILAAEVQQTGIKLGNLLRRDRLVTASGAVPAWIADGKEPPWRFRVAHVETNAREGMDPGTWTVSTGPRVLENEKCDPSSRRPCPNGRNWCGRWHPIWVPMSGITVDHIVELVPSGGLVRLVTGTKQGTILTTPEDRAAWLSQHPAGGAVDRTTQETFGDQRIRHSSYAAASLRERITTERSGCAGSVVAADCATGSQRCSRCRSEENDVNDDGYCGGCQGDLRNTLGRYDLHARGICLHCNKSLPPGAPNYVEYHSRCYRRINWGQD